MYLRHIVLRANLAIMDLENFISRVFKNKLLCIRQLIFCHTSVIMLFILLCFHTTGYSQFNSNFSSQIKCREVSHRICVSTLGQKSEIAIEVSLFLEAGKSENVTLNLEWIFPKGIPDGKGDKFRNVTSEIERPTNENFILSYSIIENADLVKGKWRLKLYHKRQLLLEREYFIQ